MSYFSRCNKFTSFIIIMLIFFTCIKIYSILFIVSKNIIKENLDNNNKITNSEYNKFKLDLQPCSYNCCKHIQWPLPKELDKNNPNNDYISSNFFCNNGKGSGCVCLNKNNLNFLSNKGYFIKIDKD